MSNRYETGPFKGTPRVASAPDDPILAMAVERAQWRENYNDMRRVDGKEPDAADHLDELIDAYIETNGAPEETEELCRFVVLYREQVVFGLHGVA